MEISSQGTCQWSPGDCFIGTHSKAKPVDSATISCMQKWKHFQTLIKTYVAETILNAASANPSHWGDVSHGGQHRNATMLKFCLATSLEVLHASVGGKACGVPETHGRLHTEFILECAQRRCCVVGPVTPGASGQAILRHGSHSREQKHRAAASRLLMILEKSWYDTMWYNMIWKDMIWFDLKWNGMIWYDDLIRCNIQYDMMQYPIWYDAIYNIIRCGAIWYVIANNAFAIWSIDKMNSITSASVMALWALRRHSINGTICACHIMKLYVLHTFCNSPCWQACASILATLRSNARYVEIVSNNQTCGVLKTWLARKKLQKLRTQHAKWQSCASWFTYVETVVLMLHSFSFCAVFLFFVSWNKQYAYRTLSPPGRTFRWWPSSPVFRWQVRHWAS